VKTFLAGEGATELSDWVNPPHYRKQPVRMGCLESLLRSTVSKDWEICGAVQWKNIRRYRARSPLSADARNLAAAALDAAEANCDSLVFARDQDGDIERHAALEDGIAEANSKFLAIKVAGGLAVRSIEAWVLAGKGDLHSESTTDAKERLRKNHGVETLAQKANCLGEAELANVPEDAQSPYSWVRRIQALFHE